MPIVRAAMLQGVDGAGEALRFRQYLPMPIVCVQTTLILQDSRHWLGRSLPDVNAQDRSRLFAIPLDADLAMLRLVTYVMRCIGFAA